MEDKIQHSKPVPPFVRFCAANIPMVFDDSLSYYECLCALWNWLQTDVINVINNNATVTQKWREELTEFEDDMTDKFDNLNDAFDTLKNWVEDYFDNLDVQEEINNKLDAMVEDGTLQEIITTYIQSNVAWTFDSVADMQSSTNLIAGSFAHTLGYYAVGDGGDAFYFITDTEPSGHYETVGDLYAELLYLSNAITPSVFGAYHDGTHDDTTALQTALNVLGDKVVKVLDLEGYTYYTTESLVIPSTYRAVIKNGEIKALNTFTVDVDTDYMLITTSENTNTYPETLGAYPTEDLTIDRINIDAQFVNGLGGIKFNKSLRVNMTGCQVKRYYTRGIYITNAGSHEINISNTNIIGFLGNDEKALNIPSIGLYVDGVDNMFSNIVIVGGQYGIYNNAGTNIYHSIHPYDQSTYSVYHNSGYGCTYDQMYIDIKGMFFNNPWLTTVSNTFFLVDSTPITLNNEGSNANRVIMGFKLIGCSGNNFSASSVDVITLSTIGFKTYKDCVFDITCANMNDNRYLVDTNTKTTLPAIFLDGDQQELTLNSQGTITATSTNTFYTKQIINNIINVTAFNTTGWSQLGIVINLEANTTYKIINRYTNSQQNFKVYAYDNIATSETATPLKNVAGDVTGYMTFNTGNYNNIVLALVNKGIFDIEITKVS